MTHIIKGSDDFKQLEILSNLTAETLKTVAISPITKIFGTDNQILNCIFVKDITPDSIIDSKITGVNFQSMEWSDENIIKFLKNHLSLSCLFFNDNENITDALLTEIPILFPNLQTFKLDECPKITPQAAETLAKSLSTCDVQIKCFIDQ